MREPRSFFLVPLGLVLLSTAACSSDSAGTGGSGGGDTSGDGGSSSTRAGGGDDDSGSGASDGGSPPSTSPSSSSSGPATTGSTGAGGEGGAPIECSEPMTPCGETGECCEGAVCGDTSLGQVCCGMDGASCATDNGEDCCGSLLCIDGACSWGIDEDACAPACTEAPGLQLEKHRLMDFGGLFLGICGDANHTYGYHVPAANLPSDDYSLDGPLNEPVCEWHACAMDFGMVDWPVSRQWLRWLIGEIAADRITGVYEVIGSYDGVDVRYWSDDAGWTENGVPYTGEGHDTHTHVSIYRSTALDDHRLLTGWGFDYGPDGAL